MITAVDPKRKHFFDYSGVDIFKPNLKEAREALNLLIDEVNERTLADIHQKLKAELDHRISFITLSEKGVFYKDGKSSQFGAFPYPERCRCFRCRRYRDCCGNAYLCADQEYTG